MKTQDIADRNPWWKFNKNFHYYDNNLKSLSKKPITFQRDKMELKTGNIYIIRGPRQTGKTVWIKQIIKELIEQDINPKSILYLSCDCLTGKTRKEFQSALKFYLDNIGIDVKPLVYFS